MDAGNCRGRFGYTFGERVKFFRSEDWCFHEAFDCFGEADDCGDIFGPSPAFIFVASTEKDWMRKEGGMDVERAGAFWSVKFMRADSDEIGFELRNVCELDRKSVV